MVNRQTIMRMREILTPSFKELRRELGIPERRRPMVEECRADDSDFCQEVVRRGWLTEEQMHHAAERYQLGKSRSGRCIFWMIDRQGRVRDGHIGDQWVSEMLKARAPQLLGHWHAEHCLFGLVLTDNVKIQKCKNATTAVVESERTDNVKMQKCKNATIAVVESERSAVILSELFPEHLWMASVYPANLSARLLEPLKGCQVTLFPRTDEDGETFLAWLAVAEEARREYGLDVTVSSILEDNATEEQKARHIDLVDFLFEHGSHG